MIDYVKLCLLFVHRGNCFLSFGQLALVIMWSRPIRIFIHKEDSRDFISEYISESTLAYSLLYTFPALCCPKVL